MGFSSDATRRCCSIGWRSGRRRCGRCSGLQRPTPLAQVARFLRARRRYAALGDADAGRDVAIRTSGCRVADQHVGVVGGTSTGPDVGLGSVRAEPAGYFVASSSSARYDSPGTYTSGTSPITRPRSLQSRRRGKRVRPAPPAAIPAEGRIGRVTWLRFRRDRGLAALHRHVRRVPDVARARGRWHRCAGRCSTTRAASHARVHRRSERKPSVPPSPRPDRSAARNDAGDRGWRADDRDRARDARSRRADLGRAAAFTQRAR